MALLLMILVLFRCVVPAFDGGPEDCGNGNGWERPDDAGQDRTNGQSNEDQLVEFEGPSHNGLGMFLYQ